ncbi:MAG: ATP-binding protein [Coraliomargarita sp.]
MTHILLINDTDNIPESLREVVLAPNIRSVNRRSPEEASSALERQVFSLVVICSDDNATVLKKTLRSLREISPDIPTIIFSSKYGVEMEQLAFEEGADLYLSDPIPQQSLERIILKHAGEDAQPQSGFPPVNLPSSNQSSKPQTASALQILRDFSQVLSFSLDYKAFSQHFILKLRDHISFSRIGIFLECTAKQSLVRKPHNSNLECIASLGLPSDLIDCFHLSGNAGITRSLRDYPRIINIAPGTANPLEAMDPSIRKEFDILGCHLAVPITDRERLIGVALLNGPVTARSYNDEELQLLYVLMEELGMAIRNSRLHTELAGHGELIENVLSSMASGAIVIGEGLDVLYSNRAANDFLKIPSNSARPPEWADLPNKLAGPVHQAVEKGELPAPFLISDDEGDKIYRISIIPFSQNSELVLLPRPAMIIIEDFTHIEASKQSEVADSRNQVISLMAERFAHEIRNSLVPLTTHAQLIDKKIEQPKFQASLKSALLNETSRIKRFSEQMLYLAQDSIVEDSHFDLSRKIQEAFDQATKQFGSSTVPLEFKNRLGKAPMQGNAEAIAYAFEEIFLNAMQAQPNDSTIEVHLEQNSEGILRIRIKDGGVGFESSTIDQATEPFYTTRNTGVGLGLSVANKVITEHHGFLRINPRSESADWDIEIELPSLLTTHV